MLIVTTKSKFSLGQIVITPNALDELSPEAVQRGLAKHASGDWGAVCQDDSDLNDQALLHGDRLFSVYFYGNRKFWIITEADRSSTTVLLPEDY